MMVTAPEFGDEGWIKIGQGKCGQTMVRVVKGGSVAGAENV